MDHPAEQTAEEQIAEALAELLDTLRAGKRLEDIYPVRYIRRTKCGIISRISQPPVES